jgi:hypothetical protein
MALSVLFFGSKAERKKAINLILQFKIKTIIKAYLLLLYQLIIDTNIFIIVCCLIGLW